MMLSICTMFHGNILDDIKVIELTIFIGKISKGHDSIKNVGGVMVRLLSK